MTEIERLRADLETIKAANDIYNRDYKGCDAQAIIGIMEKKIARLEAEAADPWREVKRDIENSRSSTFEKCQRFIAYVDYLTAESERLAKRVAELEGERAAEDEISDDYYNVNSAAKEAYDKAHKPIADIQPPFEGQIVGFDPVLDSARVLATAAEALKTKWRIDAIQWLLDASENAKPYPLKGVDNGS